MQHDIYMADIQCAFLRQYPPFNLLVWGLFMPTQVILTPHWPFAISGPRFRSASEISHAVSINKYSSKLCTNR